MKNQIFILALILLNLSCFNRKPCDYEPEEFYTDEPIVFNFVNNLNENIFLNIYDIDSLKIFENKFKINFEIYENNIIKFKTKTFSDSSMRLNLNKDLKSELIFCFDSVLSDTVIINAKFVIDENCNFLKYEYVEIFNYDTLLKSSNLKCITCSKPLTIIVENK